MPYASPELRSKRIQAKHEAGAFATRLGVTPCHYRQVERGTRVGSRTLFLLAGIFLGCDANDLTKPELAARSHATLPAA